MIQSRLVYCKARDWSIARSERSPNPHLCRICNTVVGATPNPLLALKTNLTDSCGLKRFNLAEPDVWSLERDLLGYFN